MPNVLGILKGSGSAIQLIKSLMLSGTPASDVLSQVRAAGYELIPSTANLVINYLSRTVLPANVNLQSLADNTLPNLASIPLSLTKSLRNFSYLVKLTGQTAFGDQFEDRYISVSTNSLLTKEQSIEEAISVSQVADKSMPISSATGDVESISQNSAGLVNLESIIPAPNFSLTEDSEATKQAVLNNREYLLRIASGPVQPIAFSLTGKIGTADVITSLEQFISVYSK